MEERKLKVFRMNDFDWFADYSVEEALKNYRENCELFDEELEEPKELSEIELDTQRIVFPDEERTSEGEMQSMSFREYLRTLDRPQMFASFDIVQRLIFGLSNKGEIIFDPFGGLMTVPYKAVEMKRYGYGVELNPEYFRDGSAYMRAIEEKIEMPSLFDFIEEK